MASAHQYSLTRRGFCFCCIGSAGVKNATHLRNRRNSREDNLRSACDSILQRVTTSKPRILPFADPVSFAGYIDFETATYAAQRTRTAA
jgi:hypothetical protein